MHLKSVMDLSLVKHGLEGMVSRNMDNMFGTLAGMYLTIVNDIIDREGIRFEMNELDRAFHESFEIEEIRKQNQKIKEALENGDEESVKNYLAMLYMVRKGTEGRQ